MKMARRGGTAAALCFFPAGAFFTALRFRAGPFVGPRRVDGLIGRATAVFFAAARRVFFAAAFFTAFFAAAFFAGSLAGALRFAVFFVAVFFFAVVTRDFCQLTRPVVKGGDLLGFAAAARIEPFAGSGVDSARG